MTGSTTDAFSGNVEKELNRGRRYGTPLGMVVLDLHRFKEVNDKTWPSSRVDEVLRGRCATINKAVRTSDPRSEAAGDELLFSCDTDAEQPGRLRRVETVSLKCCSRCT